MTRTPMRMRIAFAVVLPVSQRTVAFHTTWLDALEAAEKVGGVVSTGWLHGNIFKEMKKPWTPAGPAGRNLEVP